MKHILFVGGESPVKPVLAAAALVAMGREGVRVAVAAGGSEQSMATAKAAVRDAGLPWPAEIHDPASVNLAAYDLVIRFGGGLASEMPALPGSPAFLSWQVTEPAAAAGGYDAAALAGARQEIEALVHGLVGQGYLDALVQARRSAELVMDSLHEGIIAHDRHRRIFFFNRAAERITGYLRHEILGRDCHEVFPDRFCKAHCSFCEPEGEPALPDKPYPLVLHAKSGESRHLEMNVVGMRDFFGVLTGVVASFRDVTREHDLASRLGEAGKFAGIIGRTPRMLEVFRAITDLADSRVAVLLEGESGTGKELVAAAIHNQGKRHDKLFVPINCGALPEHLLETELFGHVRGAFTGAIRDKKGRFELADGGTLFLDEIGDISPSMQVKLLRVLQDGTFQRVGGEETITVDVRVISATHKDLRAEIAAGRFREDLYYRLCVVPLALPPLRERRDDIPLLARYFLKRTLEEEGRADKVVISAEALDRLTAYHWPGNVRELQNVIRYGLVHCREEMFRPSHLPPQLFRAAAHTFTVQPSPPDQRGKLTVEAVRAALAVTKGNRLQAAKRLGVGRATLYRFLGKHSVD
ncbi:MAG: sigma 54-interacting transcriptional regulator [Desulfobulbaceae bacterium]|nr:sigma 54-interacting transcriptional regulator [Desulfobulbaceae bacterium]